MPLELTPEQHRAIQAEGGHPVEVHDPAGPARYVLLPHAEYARLRNGSPWPGATPWRIHVADLPTPPEVEAAARAHCRAHFIFWPRQRREVLEQLKLQYHFGGRLIRYLPTRGGLVVVAVLTGEGETDRLDESGLSPEDLQQTVCDVPPVWSAPGTTYLDGWDNE